MATMPEFEAEWQKLGWQPSAMQQAQFQKLYELVLDGNRQLNLTRITEPTDFWEKHLWDSLRGIAPFLPNLNQVSEALTETANSSLLPSDTPLNVIDIGTGGGFPGLPAAIAQPSWKITLLDATRKKVQFLNTLISTLELQNVRTLVDRAEQTGHHPHHRAQYDLALLRAVASAPACAEYALPLLKIGGVAVLYRGQWTPEEADQLETAVAQLGGAIAFTDAFTTPITQGIRHCLYLRKVEPTPAKFPRAVGVPAQQPLS
jgi:16S rRNA (guanine527-N7)-methyltransferase